FVALWNPLEFYYVARPGIGYRLYSENIVTHDDFLSCDSKQADDHVRRQLVKMNRTDGPELTMYHSLAGPFFEPTLGAKKIFYVGINWERVGGKRSRHQDIMNLLDGEGCMRIYGPQKIRGIRVWEGFKSYVDEIPFDGASVIERIAEAGIALVLSSDAHKDAEMMSNRLFEALAAGAVVIADENSFCKKHFGDTLLYIDTTLSAKKVVQDILAHVAWIKANPEAAIDLARRAQAIFMAHYRMDQSIEAIYARLEAQKALPKNAIRTPVTLYFLMPMFDEDVLIRHMQSVAAQNPASVECVLVVDMALSPMYRKTIAETLEKSPCPVRVVEMPFFNPALAKPKKSLPLGSVIWALYSALPDGALVCFIEPQERIFSDHVAPLVTLLDGQMEQHVAQSSMVMSQPRDGHDPILIVHNDAALLGLNPDQPFGMARFLLRKDPSQLALDAVVPYLQVKPIAAFVVNETPLVSYRVSVLREIASVESDALALDNEILLDIIEPGRGNNGGSALAAQTDILEPRKLSLHLLSRGNKLNIIKELFEQLPLPRFLHRFVYFVYHLLGRRQ
ncbi:MAG: hypothetical protein B7Z52_02280, partial [Burkholderiales bacterium 12-64-5]